MLYRCLLVACLSPGLAWASPWVEQAGVLRTGIAYSGSASQGQFAPGDTIGFTGPLCAEPIQPGDRTPFSCVVGGQFALHGLFGDLSLGLHKHVSLDVSVPVVLHASYDDTSSLPPSVARGLGDVRVGSRVGGQLGRWALSGALHVGIPTGVRPTGHRDIPIGEGHWGLEPGVRAGIGLGRWGWAETHQSFRFRVRTANAGTRQGHEWTGQVSGGVTPLPSLAFTVGLEGIAALPGADDFGLNIPGRKLLQARGGLGWRGGNQFWLSVSVAAPLVGSKWPTGPVFSLSFSARVRLWGEPDLHGRDPR